MSDTPTDTASPTSAQSNYTFDDLERLLVYLRDPQYGCPWDVAQTPETIVPYTIEEVYEVVEAIESRDWQGLGEELGDLLLQVVFYAQMAKEAGYFDLKKVVDQLVRKMVRRHPHVFPEGRLAPPSERQSAQAGQSEPNKVAVSQVKQTWESIKQQERAEKKACKKGQVARAHLISPTPLADSLVGVPKGLDALASAQKVQIEAARFGLDWRDKERSGSVALSVFAGLKSEVAELSQAMEANNGKCNDQESGLAIAAELGDVLFSCVNLARHLELDAAQCLRQSTRKFKQRAIRVEQLFLAANAQANTAEQGMASASEAELDQFWQAAKSEEHP